jgi:hypothetical protein
VWEQVGSSTALLAATALHTGFQATVSLLVYPALARVRQEDWSDAHGHHTRAITPLVGVVYTIAAVTALAALLSSPGSVAVWLSASGTATAFAVTALVAGPTHGRLGRGRTPSLMRRLLVGDRVRLVGSLVALAGALLAVTH